MDAKKKQELLSQLKNKFDDYIDYYDLMECLPGVSEQSVKRLKQFRNQNGLGAFSHYTERGGTLLVSTSKFILWYENNFRPLED